MNTILPIGSVVKVKQTEMPLMIFGMLQQNGFQPERFVDYVGVPYPVGNLGMQTQIGFQAEDITEVLFEGYNTKESDYWKEVLRLKKQGDEQKKKEEEQPTEGTNE